MECDLPTPSSHPVCLCVAQQQTLDCASLFKPQRRLLLATATWALAEGHGAAVGPARARVEPCGGHGYAVHARPVCAWSARVDGGVGCAKAAVGEVVGSHEGVPLGVGALCARVSCCARLPWPWLAARRSCKASGERASDSIIQCFFLGLFGMILSRTNDARVWLYVKLTSFPLWHGLRGSMGWAWHSNSGPLDFTVAGVAVTVLYLH